ncbi:carbohydrate-binding family 9-like protein [Rhodohalobacter sulfatireducens]|uniref:Carbohydrate-binding family 9-like protein n=1 Tax=Rhodohalobacter sulfatireducens TaxID=2911366 RepID=A0ABS9K9F5_9BACT|nr:carbohydrate-binding family 9-like protein [Rhodohalobacter sulfatireducens]MCG2587492.1 carbohydrate-binding family 9-like protein [Rhodohalobacter sulfatireducens]
MVFKNLTFRTSTVRSKGSFLYKVLIIPFLIFIALFNTHPLIAQALSTVQVQKTDDFSVTGDGSSHNWSETNWIELTQRANHENDNERTTFVKVLYSDTGIYFLFRCDDDLVSATITSHFEEIWREDVVEVFLWPSESEELYFEYELSPLNYELPLLVSKTDTGQSHWVPFQYSYSDGDSRKAIHKTSATGGMIASGEIIDEWRAEFFIPFELLIPLKNRIPKSGTTWRANMYRVDYDHGSTSWTWQPVTTNFHDIYNYGTLVFE